MTLTGLPGGLSAAAIEEYPGLDLRNDPETAGAVDVLNVEFPPGRVRQRDGYTGWAAGGSLGPYRTMSPYYTLSGTKQLVAAQGSATAWEIDTFPTTGVGGPAITRDGPVYANSYARFGTPSAEYLYVGNNSATGQTLARWDGAAWTTPPGVPGALYLTVESSDNRLIAANITTAGAADTSRVKFSDPGLPETWRTENFVDLSPGDGEQITGLVAWREMVFAFKASRFFVFTGTATDPQGAPVFNYRPVSAGVGCVSLYGGAVAGREGVYFLDRTGVYVTTGGEPARISDPISPYLRGDMLPLFGGPALDQAKWDQCVLSYVANRLWLTVPVTGGGRRTLVYDPQLRWWSFYDIDAWQVSSFRVGAAEDVVFGRDSVTGAIVRYGPAYTTDNGTQITSRYRSGLTDLGRPASEKTVRETELVGTGTVSLAWAREFESPPSAQSVSLGSTHPQRGLSRQAQVGELLSYQLASVSGAPWTVHRVVPMLRETRSAGEKT